MLVKEVVNLNYGKKYFLIAHFSEVNFSNQQQIISVILKDFICYLVYF